MDDDPWAAYMVPPLTTIQMGRDAAQIVLSMINGKPLPEFQGELIIRESVARQR